VKKKIYYTEQMPNIRMVRSKNLGRSRT
jgi:hypothetical protein